MVVCILSTPPPRAEAVVTQGSRIIFVGTSSAARNFAGEGAEVIDLQGRLLLPGFIDDHVHFVLGGTQVDGLNLRTCTSTAEFIAGLGAYVESHRGAWMTGGDWDQEGWETKTLPAGMDRSGFSGYADVPAAIRLAHGAGE